MKSEDIQTDDEILVLMLCMSEEEARDSMNAIHKKYAACILGTLKDYGAYSEDRFDLMQEVYLRIWKKARANTLTITKSLKPLLIRITHDAWVDFVRKSSSDSDRIHSDRYKLLCEEIIEEAHMSPIKRKRAIACRDKFRTWMDSLPKKQQQVAYAWIDCHCEAMESGESFARRIGPKPVYHAMLKKGIDPGSVGAVKGAMQQFKEKFRAYIDLRALICEELT